MLLYTEQFLRQFLHRVIPTSLGIRVNKLLNFSNVSYHAWLRAQKKWYHINRQAIFGDPPVTVPPHDHFWYSRENQSLWWIQSNMLNVFVYFRQ